MDRKHGAVEKIQGFIEKRAVKLHNRGDVLVGRWRTPLHSLSAGGLKNTTFQLACRGMRKPIGARLLHIWSGLRPCRWQPPKHESKLRGAACKYEPNGPDCRQND